MHLWKGVAMSDTQYGKEQQDEDLGILAQAVSEIGEILLVEQEIKAEVDRKTAEIVAEGLKKMKPVKAESDRLIAIVAPLYQRLIDSGAVKGKTIALPSGQVSTRLATSTEVLDAPGLIRMMRRLRHLTKMSKRPARTVDKTALGELMDSNPQLAAAIEAAGLAARSTKNRMTIKPKSSKLKLEQDIGPGDRVVVLAPSSSSS